MILDSLDRSGLYEAIHPRFAQAFAFLRSLTGSETPGRHDLDGDNLFAIVQGYRTKPVEQAEFEAHRIYIDVQYIRSGREAILWAPLSTMRDQVRPYDSTKDIAKWTLVPDSTLLHLTQGQFAILFAHDAHAPGVEWDGTEEVSKTVVKVRAEL
jgi:YhcH/YjgK/YiaL family protein